MMIFKILLVKGNLVPFKKLNQSYEMFFHVSAFFWWKKETFVVLSAK